MIRALERCALPGEWGAFPSLTLAQSLRRPYREIDFRVIGPPGVLVHEVKGGRVDSHDGIWEFTDRNGRATRRRRGPLEEAEQAMHGPREHLEQTQAHGPIRDVLLGFGCIFPDCVIKADSIECDPGVVLDARWWERGFEAYLGRLTGHWQRRHLQRIGELDPGLLDRLTDICRLHIGTMSSMGWRMRGIERRQLELTRRQYAVLAEVRRSRRSTRQFRGTRPRSGKTLLALESTRRAAAAGRRVLLPSFSPVLERFLGDEMAGEAGVVITVSGRRRWLSRSTSTRGFGATC